MDELETVVEECADWQAGVEVERQSRLVRNVALVGRVSRNGHEYSEEALRSAARLYERKPVFLDHAADARRPQDRRTRDLVGSVVNPRFSEGRIRGDIRVLDTESGRTFLALAESDTPGVGMSHVVLARRNGDGTAVNRIEDVISVDAVVGPATTTTFHESTSNADIDSADGPAADVAEEIAELREAVSRLSAERDELLARLADQEALERSRLFQNEWQTTAEDLGLPGFAVTGEFLTQLENAESDESRRSLIAERVQLLHRAGAEHPRSIERNGGPGGGNTGEDEEFVAAVRGFRAAASVLAG
ncbi:MAG: hypothetical protein DWQ41_09690 [Planctomycetota bacterium]|nr:MAG: hypothetical protein DWQ41_09690 [Planctomycetota bacterium]